jgi:hypothetical protein
MAKKTQTPKIDFNAITGKGTKDSPLMYQGKRYTGTINWSTGPAKYVNGVKLTATKNPNITPDDGGGEVSTVAVPEPTVTEVVDDTVITTNANANTTTARSKFGIGEALLFDSTYGKPNTKDGLWWVNELLKKGDVAAADDAFYKTTWSKLDKDVQDRYLLSLDKSDVYNERLKQFSVNLKKLLAQSGVSATDEQIKKYFDDGIEEEVILDELISGISAKDAKATSADALSTLRSTARANGFDLDKDFANQIDGWLQRIARGEDVDDFNRLIRQQAKLGLPEKVGTLLDEGLDLANIYAPYRNTMATLLEITPDSIALNDPILRTAYGQDKEMSIYEFQRAVRKDPRWQYTDNARQEVSNSVLGVLRDFGFQG